jgi:hypothetical protein
MPVEEVFQNIELDTILQTAWAEMFETAQRLTEENDA